MSARIVPLDRFLLDELVRHERDPLTAERADGEAVVHEAMRAASFGDAFAMIDGAYVVAGAWMILHWAGLAEAKALITRFARRRHLVLLAHAAKAHMDKRQRDPAYRRIQVHIRESPRWCAAAFARAMGFTEQHHLEAFDPLGRDHLLCARIAEFG